METKKKFKDTDLIECRSVTTGKLVFEGKKSGNTYRWPSYDSVESVEYRDLIYAARDTNSRSIMYAPRFIVLDDDFIEQNPKLKDFYSTMYSYKDVAKILDLPASEMKATVLSMPQGIQDCLKGLIATAIKTGKLDSVKKVKIFDEIFGTQLLLTLATE